MQGMVDEAKAFLETAEGQDFEKDMQESFLAGSPSSQTQWAQRILAEKEKRESQGNAGQGQDSTSGMNSGKPEWMDRRRLPRAAGRECPARHGPLRLALKQAHRSVNYSQLICLYNPAAPADRLNNQPSELQPAFPARR